MFASTWASIPLSRYYLYKKQVLP